MLTINSGSSLDWKRLNHIEDSLSKTPVDNKDSILRKLAAEGLLTLDIQDFKNSHTIKLVINLANGNLNHLANAAAKRFDNTNSVINTANPDVSISRDPKYNLPRAFTSYIISTDNKEVGHVFVGDQAKGARAGFSTDVGFRKGGITGQTLMDIYRNMMMVIHAPIIFTTGFGKPTDLAIVDGIQTNRLISMNRAHGIFIIRKDGTIRLMDKRRIDIRDLYANPSDNQYGEQTLNLKEIKDYRLFFKIAAEERLSAGANMLLIDNEKISSTEDAPDWRRMLVQFSNGNIGIFNSDVRMSTADATKLLQEIRLPDGSKVVKAIYMDTGYFDYGTVIDINGKRTIIGHADKEEASNRFALGQLKDTPSETTTDKAMTSNPGGIDLNPKKINLNVQNKGESIRLGINPALLTHYKSITGLTPVIMNIQPMKIGLSSYFCK